MMLDQFYKFLDDNFDVFRYHDGGANPLKDPTSGKEIVFEVYSTEMMSNKDDINQDTMEFEDTITKALISKFTPHIGSRVMLKNRPYLETDIDPDSKDIPLRFAMEIAVSGTQFKTDLDPWKKART